MKKKILLSLICAALLLTGTSVSAEECAPTASKKEKIKIGNSEKIWLYLYTGAAGNEVAKDGYFYNQRLESTGKRAFCLDMGKQVGYNYIPSAEEYNKFSFWTHQVMNKALNFEDTVEAACNGVYKSQCDYNPELIEDFTYIIPQIALWLEISEYKDQNNNYIEKNGKYVLQEDGRQKGNIINSTISAYCSLIAYADKSYDDRKNGCYYSTNKRGEYIDNLLQGLSDEQTQTELGKVNFLFYLWNSATSTYRENPTVYVAEDADTQRLLSDYACQEPPEPTEVDPSCDMIGANIPNTCQSANNSGFIADTEDWECIFNSELSSDENIRSHYIEDNTNKYCKIFCRQDITSTLPNSSITVDQGKYMTIGDYAVAASISPLTYTGTKECRVSSNGGAAGTIDINSFAADYVYYNNQLPAAWKTAEEARLNAQAADNATCNKDGVIKECVKRREPSPEEKATCDAAGKAHQGLLEQHKQGNPEDKRSDADILADLYNVGYNNCMNNVDTSSCVDFREYDVYTCHGNARDGAFSGAAEFSYNTKENNKAAQISSFHALYRSTLNSYNSLLNARNNVLASFNSCTEQIPSNIKYNDFKPELLFKYDEPVYGNYSSGAWNLKSNLAQNINEVTYYKDGNSIEGNYSYVTTNVNDGNLKSLIASYVCETGNTCQPGAATFYNTTWWESTTIKGYKYTLQDNVYRYVLKTGESVHNVTATDDYVDIGYSNLPIHFSTNPGKYDYEIELTTFGVNNKFNDYIPGNEIYTCQYNVNCQNIISQRMECEDYKDVCPDVNGEGRLCLKGLNVIYRTISLYSKKDAFPGIDGTGRTPGANWNDDTLINDYIVNNRGVSDYEVYHLDPLYEIELTPTLMKLIRKYNKEKNNEVLMLYSSTGVARTGIAGYADFSNMTCGTDGTHCVSSLLRGLVNGYEAIEVNGCAIAGAGAHGNCGERNQAW